ncbi:MAG: fimbrial protein pilin [Candidatus Amesbacteria bacterium GW2011_GWA2_42_12]|uniref:Fimbrial protein pilin n=1 Tax=Candidatus Amesbacteria bacterium GW2011_GWA2_42_12 TaxID=1618356 RepID=A0A0G1AEG9_9BACT|nr:MAG: fimbrial protein pilin [Candidatus Amesbacteria bacterium GW2011_GWA2_42_12]
MKKGFTLIELLVTISIIAILTGFSLVAFNGTKASARDGKRKADLLSIHSALEIYRADFGGYPLATNYPTVLQPNYITAPTDTSPRLYSYKPGTCGTSYCGTYVLCAGLELVTTPADTVCTTAGASCGTNITCTYHISNP